MTNDPYVFGSWGDLGVISRGTVNGFASGSSIGYVANNAGSLRPIPYANTLRSSPNTRSNTGDIPGGSRQSKLCRYLSTLTFANDCVSGNAASGTGGKDANEGLFLDKSALRSLAKTIVSKDEIGENGKIRLDDTVSDGETAVLHTSEQDVEVQGGTLIRGTFTVVNSEKNITISGNIETRENEVMEHLSQTPKAVIFANDTIYINCNVTRIDALLVANTVVTCNPNISENDNLNDKIKAKINNRENSNQLIVNGAVVANRLYANRTYGAARGANSIVPAEIVNFDPTLYLWGGVAGNKSDGQSDKPTANNNMETTYIHEIAPRY